MLPKPTVILQMADLLVNFFTGRQPGLVNNVHFEINVSLHAFVPIRVFGVVQMLRVQQLVMLQGYESRFAIDMESKRSFREAVDGYESWARQNQAPDLLSQFGREVVESNAGLGFRSKPIRRGFHIVAQEDVGCIVDLLSVMFGDVEGGKG
jgi:hypothetical protein